MTRVVAADALSLGLATEVVSTPEWRMVCTGQHNVMLEGTEHATEGLLALLEPHLHSRTVWTRASVPLQLPAEECRGLVVQNVSRLNRDEQAALASWLEAPDNRKQVVCTTEHPLFPLVARGLFNDVLYYRLNVTLLRLDAAVS